MSQSTMQLGDRIRKCRISTGFNLNDFARTIGVSPNYMGLVERNKKQPSNRLLVKIAEATNVPTNWLLHGGPLQKTSHPAESVLLDDTQSIRLFLQLCLMYIPECSTDTFSIILSVPKSTVEDILQGNEFEYTVSMENGLSILAQRLDVPAIQPLFQKLDGYLERVALEKSADSAALAMKRFIQTGKTEYQILRPHEYIKECYTLSKDDLVSSVQKTATLDRIKITLKLDGESIFHYHSYSFFPTWSFSDDNDLCEKIFHDLIGEFYYGASVTLDSTDDAGIIFNNKEIYQRFCENVRTLNSSECTEDSVVNASIDCFLISEDDCVVIDHQEFSNYTEEDGIPVRIISESE